MGSCDELLRPPQRPFSGPYRALPSLDRRLTSPKAMPAVSGLKIDLKQDVASHVKISRHREQSQMLMPSSNERVAK